MELLSMVKDMINFFFKFLYNSEMYIIKIKPQFNGRKKNTVVLLERYNFNMLVEN